MQLRFDQMGSAPARALQIYLVLIGCAANRQTIPYTALAKRLGLLTPTWLPASLSYLADWCLEEGLPPLTSLAVADDSGIPGPGYPVPLESLSAQQSRTHKFDWYAIIPPTMHDLERPYPSTGPGWSPMAHAII